MSKKPLKTNIYINCFGGAGKPDEALMKSLAFEVFCASINHTVSEGPNIIINYCDPSALTELLENNIFKQFLRATETNTHQRTSPAPESSFSPRRSASVPPGARRIMKKNSDNSQAPAKTTTEATGSTLTLPDQQTVPTAPVESDALLEELDENAENEEVTAMEQNGRTLEGEDQASEQPEPETVEDQTEEIETTSPVEKTTQQTGENVVEQDTGMEATTEPSAESLPVVGELESIAPAEPEHVEQEAEPNIASLMELSVGTPALSNESTTPSTTTPATSPTTPTIAEPHSLSIVAPTSSPTLVMEEPPRSPRNDSTVEEEVERSYSFPLTPSVKELFQMLGIEWGEYEIAEQNQGTPDDESNNDQTVERIVQLDHGTPGNEQSQRSQAEQNDQIHERRVSLSPTPLSPLFGGEMNEDPTGQPFDFQAAFIERCIPHELLGEERRLQSRHSMPPTIPAQTPTNATTRKRVWSESVVGQADLLDACNRSPLDPSDSALLARRMRVRLGKIPEVPLASVAQSGQRRGKRTHTNSSRVGSRKTKKTVSRNAPASGSLRTGLRSRKTVNYCGLDSDDSDDATNKRRRKNSESSNGSEKRVKRSAGRPRPKYDDDLFEDEDDLLVDEDVDHTRKSVRMTPAVEKAFQKFLATQPGSSTREAHFRETDKKGRIWITMTNEELKSFREFLNRDR